MKKLLILLPLVWMMACTSSTPVKTFPYSYIDSKTVNGNFQLQLEIYHYSGPIDNIELKRFVSQVARGSGADIFYLAIFDKETNAGFPTKPLTAEYGGDPQYSKHIRVFFSYNRNNGYNELSVYPTNKYESSPKRFKLSL
jgi:hypothetical protein